MLTFEKNCNLRRVQTMNSILYNPAQTELDIRYITSGIATPEDMYATSPLVVVRPTYAQPNEEELHTSFEEAISDRVLAVNRQLRHLSVPLSGSLSVQPPASMVVHQRNLTLFGRAWRQGMLFVAIAFMLVMVGFDLMGLLVLHMR
jgi:hypothetical protein